MRFYGRFAAPDGALSGESGDYEHAFRMGLAAGSASAFSEQLATKDEIKKVYENCRITKIG